MTKKADPKNIFLKLDISRELWARFDEAMRLHHMPRGKSLVLRQMISDFCDDTEERFKKRAAKTLRG